MKAMFTVGEIARLHKLQKQTLIFYDKQGVFKPNIIDANNGYRYYTADQLEVLDSIIMLRDIGFTLNEIKEFIASREPSQAAKLLQKQKLAMEAQAARLTETAQKLKRKIESLNSLETDKCDKIINTVKDEYFAVEKIAPPNTLLQTDIATKKLLTRAYSEEYPFFYQVGVIVPLQNILNGKCEEAEYACLPLNKKINKQDLFVKPAGLYAKGFHEGSYSQIGSSYERILSYILRQGFAPQSYSFEYCISDSLTAKKPEEYVTEIQIPVNQSKHEL